MILCIDAGNTRWKWAVFNKAQLIDHGVANKAHSDDFRQQLRNLSSSLEGRRGIEAVLVCSVAGSESNRALLSVIESEFSAPVKFVEVTQQCAGVTAAYKKLQNLGVDRWMAMVAAWNLFFHPCVIIDAGSAITVDYVNAKGVHEGGLIAPGVRLMQQALFSETAQVKVDALNIVSEWRPKLDSLPCVENGVTAMLKGFVEQVLIHIDDSKVDYKIVLTGGDAQALLPFIKVDCVERPLLVLEGLAFAFASSCP